MLFFPNLTTDRLTPKVRHVANGLKKSQNRSFRFSNFARSPLLTQLIRRESVQSEFAHASFFSFLFAIRVPSESLHLRRANRGDQLIAFSPQPEKALIGTAVVGGGNFLVAKFSWRGNMVGGCILRRPCFCLLGRRHDTSLLPIRRFWAEVRRRVSPGQLLFRSVSRGNFNRMLKAVFTQLHVPGAERYSSHGFRRGAAQELKESCSPFAAVASAGVWKSPSPRGYIDVAKDVEMGVSALFDADQDSASDADHVHMGF